MTIKVLILGACPPPYTGQSISLEKLKSSLLEDNDFVVKHVDFAPKKKHTTGRLNYTRVYETVMIILKYFWYLIAFKPNIIYLTKGSSKWGFIRDYTFQILQKLFSPKTRFIVHLKGGNYDAFHGRSSRTLQYFILDFLKKCHTIIVLGPSLIKMYDFCPSLSNKIKVVYNALPQDNKLSFLQKENDIIHVTYLSNMILSKGYIDILHASEKMKELKIHFHFAGEFMLSPDDEQSGSIIERKEEFLGFIKSHKLTDTVTYHGVVIGSEKNKLLELSDIFILPSYYHVEGQPISIIEAMSCCNAIVTTKYRSIPDIVSEGLNSIFVKEKSSEDIVSALTEFYHNRMKLRDFQSNSYQKYLEKHTWERHYQSMIRIFKEE